MSCALSRGILRLVSYPWRRTKSVNKANAQPSNSSVGTRWQAPPKLQNTKRSEKRPGELASKAAPRRCYVSLHTPLESFLLTAAPHREGIEHDKTAFNDDAPDDFILCHDMQPANGP